MENLIKLAESILHLDKILGSVINTFGYWTYVIVFLVIFAETGLVVTPFLPGDSLLFVLGTLSGSGYLNITFIYLTLLAAAILGDTVNYWVGHYIGPQVFNKTNSRIFKKEYLEKTREFYAKYGGKAIILARFIPIIRTFAPFVAGIGKMHYRTFIIYNIVGGFIWVTLFLYAGYFFGGLEIVKHNFHYAVVGIIFVSILPVIFEYLNYKRGLHLSKKQMSHAKYSEVVKTIHDKVEAEDKG